jgi:hypothetical protein
MTSRTPLWLALISALLVAAGGIASGGAGWLACQEDVEAGTRRADVCAVLGTDQSFLLLAIAPGLAMLLAATVAPRTLTAAFAAVVLLVETVVLAVVLQFAL